MQVIKLLTFEGRIKGVLCLDKKEKEEPSYVLIWCENVILATGDLRECTMTVYILFPRPVLQAWLLKLALWEKISQNGSLEWHL